MILEIVLTVVIVVALLLFFGVSPGTILLVLGIVVLGLIALTILAMFLFFVLTDVALLFRKPVKGTFLRVDDSGRFDHAVYQVGEAEYSCNFPAESFGRKHIYQENKQYLLLIPRSEKRKTAYDRHSLMIVAIGTLLSTLLFGLMIIGVSFFRSIV